MLQLFYSPGACSMVTHVALEESGAGYEATRVVLADGEHHKPEFLAINPHARVPALRTKRGIITENIAILNFIADEFQKDGSVPRGDSFAAAKCNELLGWFASTVHISFAQLWRPERFTRETALHEAIISGGRENLASQFREIEEKCSDGWMAGASFSAADAYALTFFRWGKRIEVDMRQYPRWAALCARVIERPAVGTVLEREGLQADAFLP
jgi:glutathione S-transferase